MSSAWCPARLSCHCLPSLPVPTLFQAPVTQNDMPWAITVGWLPTSHFLTFVLSKRTWFSSFWHWHTVRFRGPHNAPECRFWLVYSHPGRSIPVVVIVLDKGMWRSLGQWEVKGSLPGRGFLWKCPEFQKRTQKRTETHLFSTSRRGSGRGWCPRKLQYHVTMGAAGRAERWKEPGLWERSLCPWLKPS